MGNYLVLFDGLPHSYENFDRACLNARTWHAVVWKWDGAGWIISMDFRDQFRGMR